MNIIETPTRRQLDTRVLPIRSIILHTTGETDLDKIIAWYTSAGGLQPHYMIELSGAIRHFVDEKLIAYHTKIYPDEARLYQLGYASWSTWRWVNDQVVHHGVEYPGYAQWRDLWRPAGMQSPLDLITGAHPNGSSVGIELQQPEYPGERIFTDDQYAALAELVADIGKRRAIPLDRRHLLTHYDCSPMRRCNARGSSDPGAGFSFPLLWSLLSKRATGRVEEPIR